MKLWAGRFSKELNADVNDFNSSIRFDARLYRQDIRGSIAHATMLGERGILSPEETKQITLGLSAILEEVEAGTLSFSAESEDIHMNMEVLLTERIGPAGGRLHTGRSRNDQVATDFRLYVREEIGAVRDMLLTLLSVLRRRAGEELHTIMPGYTHLQRAQPVTLAHCLMAYANMLRRDVTRLEDCLARMDECPLGAGALATTTHPIDRHRTAELLGFAKPMENSLDAVSDRDFALEFLSCASILMMHLSRFSEEIILWCSFEFRFIELDDAFATGSSIMPQKKNPDIPELVRGKTGRVYGALMALLTVMKGLPLAYNKDMQEDKEPVFDTIDTLKLCLPVFSAMLDSLKVRPETMRAAASEGFLSATDCADYLTRRGLPFREAYGIVGKLVAHCLETGSTLETLPLSDYQSISPLFEADVYKALSLDTCVEGRAAHGGPAPAAVQAQIEAISAFLKEREQA